MTINIDVRPSFDSMSASALNHNCNASREACYFFEAVYRLQE